MGACIMYLEVFEFAQSELSAAESWTVRYRARLFLRTACSDMWMWMRSEPTQDATVAKDLDISQVIARTRGRGTARGKGKAAGKGHEERAKARARGQGKGRGTF